MRTSLLAAVVVFACWAGSASPAAAQAAGGCDRPCMTDVVTRFLDSLVKHDPKAAPLAEKVRFTEDAMQMAVGDGFWKTATRLRPYRIDFIDLRESTAAVLAVMEEGANPVFFSARLKVVNRRITEIETMVVRNAQEAMLFAPDSVKEKSVPMTLMPDKAKLTPRAQMIEIALRYPEGLRTGSFVKANVPFAPGAYRLENGVRMAGPGCTFQPPACEDMLNQRIPTLSEMKSRVVAVDEEAGLVLLRLDFGRGSLMGGGAGRGRRGGGPGAGPGVPPAAGAGAAPAAPQAPAAPPAPPATAATAATAAEPVEQVLVTFEGFKIYDGKLHAVEAVFESMPRNTPSGWD